MVVWLSAFFSSWGESFFIAIQVVILMMMMFHYNKQLSYMVVFLAAYSGIVWYLLSPYVTTEILTALQALNIPLIVASRVSVCVCVCMLVIVYVCSLMRVHVK